MAWTARSRSGVHRVPSLRVALRCALAAVLPLSATTGSAAERRERRLPPGTEAQFVVPQAEYTLGGPIVLAFVVRNRSDEDLHFGIADNPVWGFRFKEVAPARGHVRPLKLRPGGTEISPDPHCVPPGEILRKRILLNRYLTFKTAGTHRLLCEIDAPLLPPRRGGQPRKAAREYLSLSQEVEIVVRPFDRQAVTATADRLVQRLSHPNATARLYAAQELAYLHPEIARPRLEAALSHRDSFVRAAAVDGLARVAGRAAIPIFVRALDSQQGRPRERIAHALGYIGAGDPQALEALYSLLADEDEGTRLTAIMSVGRIGDGASIARLEPLLKHPDPRTRRVAGGWIEHLRRRYPQ